MGASSNPAISVSADQLLLRRMRSEDVSDIMAIESVSFGRHHWSADSFHNEIKNQIGRYYSLIYRGTPKAIGYAGYWMILDEAHITTIAVHPDFRGNSLGELLLVKLLDKAMGQTIRWVTLEVRASNFSAQNLYYKYGFRTVGTRTRYYQDNNEDALIMTTSNILSEEFRTLFKANKARLLEKLSGSPSGLESHV